MELLKTLCGIHAPSGEEAAMAAFVRGYVERHGHQWACVPEVRYGSGLQDCVMLVFGKPRVAVFAHMDSIGFTVRYDSQLVPIGSPEAIEGTLLSGADHLGPIECALEVREDQQSHYRFSRGIARGTSLVFKRDFRETDTHVQSCYLDNRLGVYNALRLAETMTDGIIAFSCWEEHGGGTVPYLIKTAYEDYGVRQALVSDITWVTDGVRHGEGVAISLRDRNIPRKAFVDQIIAIAQDRQIPHQLEVEGGGSSDGREIQQSPYPIDWCFVGAPESHVHSPNELVYKSDIDAMLALYRALAEAL